MATVTLARHAMATRFEIVLQGNDPVALRAAGEEALAEISQLESRLSLFQPASEIAHVNALAATRPVRVSPDVFELLSQASRISRETGGAFDITVAPLVRCWGFMGGSGRQPPKAEIEAARALVGMQYVGLEQKDFTVTFARPGMMLDLGAIGKGYAIAQAEHLLREAGVENALIHGGTSTVCAIGRPEDGDAWKVAIDLPSEAAPEISPRIAASTTPGQGRKEPPKGATATLAVVSLRNEALSVSGIHGKFFKVEEAVLGHILDPRTGHPATNAILSAVVLPSATETDALSTALLTLGLAGHDALANLRPAMRTLVVARTQRSITVKSRGIALEPEVAR